MIENLADLLSPQFADRVFVNGKNLTPRDIVTGFQDRIEVPVLGEIRVYIYQPGKVRHRDGMRIDELKIGSIGPVMEFRSFAKCLSQELRNRIPFAFFDRGVCGLIEVEGFNEWREGASREFRDELFSTREIEIFIDYLESILGPKISREFGLEETDVKDKERRNFDALRALTEEAFGKITGVKKTPRERLRSRFNVSPWTVTMVPGEEQVFEARGRQSDSFIWNCSDVPGASLDKIAGSKVVMSIATDVEYDLNEQYRLVVQHKETGISRVAHIKIAPFKELTVIPRGGSHFVGDMITFKAINVPERTKTLNWEVSPATFGEFTRKEGLANIGLVLKRPGKCTVRAFDSDNSAVSSTSDIYVKELEIDADGGESDFENPVIKLEDTIMEFRTFISRDVAQQGFVEEKNPHHLIFHINVEHPKYHKTLKTAESAWREYVLFLAVMNYASWKASKTDMDNEERLRLTGSILAKVA
ncbi:hypothetical protein HQ571_06575 [Candidatus Kuenenbacteria bacterium]|nr:hypothetical protein [Candidatus Kuenenbacteria bacterium]